MKKIGIISMVIFAVFVAGLAGCGTAPSSTPTSPEIVTLESPLHIICVSTGEGVEGNNEELWEEMNRLLDASIHTRPSLVPVGADLQWLTSNTIYLNHPENLECLQDLEAEYPQLLPLSCDELESELESYSSAILYFSRDVEADKIRGIIVAEEVYIELAELLSEGVPLDVPFRYENGQLQILE
jgi:hypothetical protein